MASVSESEPEDADPDVEVGMGADLERELLELCELSTDETDSSVNGKSNSVGA